MLGKNKFVASVFLELLTIFKENGKFWNNLAISCQILLVSHLINELFSDYFVNKVRLLFCWDKQGTSGWTYWPLPVQRFLLLPIEEIGLINSANGSGCGFYGCLFFARFNWNQSKMLRKTLPIDAPYCLFGLNLWICVGFWPTPIA